MRTAPRRYSDPEESRRRRCSHDQADRSAGLAAGQSVAGIVVEVAEPSAAFLAGGVAGALLAGVLWVRRGTLRAEAQAPQPAALATA